ncbi:uroporphyrinogen-III synthase [Acinetobacter sp. KS-LM10]|uniref:uroporphyrinogen-III synthase n=1 Tax=Acinetobacter sp. KS-LM10 TaxID=3120518 RepID=UPI0030D5693E
MIFINTRPPDRAKALTQCLEQADFNVIELPVLALRAKPFDETLRLNYQALPDASMIVVVSPTAVDIGMRYLQLAGLDICALRHIQWVAVGKTTAAALAQYGVESAIPEVETSEGMLSLSIFNTLNGIENIAFWRGEGGRQFMMQELQSKDISILNFVLYERYCPEQTIQKFPEISAYLIEKERLKQVPYWVCISSEASWKNWLMLCRHAPELLSKCHYLVLGERLYQLLVHDKAKLKQDYAVSQLVDLNPQTILKSIHHWRKTL